MLNGALEAYKMAVKALRDHLSEEANAADHQAWLDETRRLCDEMTVMAAVVKKLWQAAHPRRPVN